ncbi:hypothetical protein N7495_001540 [Penicillium taxi]|uniref:uncharacterized protein n=1 Tax=Penicillium taxi TaxID=168475 RepID=UPI0025454870|nr:uncharacterized protein N7495_001540 [Penicillium taxi]KAJ5908858.1 hypothetical protein N7495_001540 [Penicillium taxi]
MALRWIGLAAAKSKQAPNPLTPTYYHAILGHFNPPRETLVGHWPYTLLPSRFRPPAGRISSNFVAEAIRI